MMKKAVLLLFIIFLCTACSEYQAQTSLDEMRDTVQSAARDNQQIARQRVLNLPSDVDKALLVEGKLQIDGAFSGRGKRFDLAVDNMDAKTFYMSLVADTPYNMVVSPELKGEISLNLKQVTLDEVMDTVRDIYGYDYIKNARGYRVFANGLQTRTFNVNYLDILRNGNTQTLTSSGQISEKLNGNHNGVGSSVASGNYTASRDRNLMTGSGSRVVTSSEMDFWKDLETSVTAILKGKEGRQVIMNAGAGMVMVTAYPSELRAVSEYLVRLQQRIGRQVVLETKILEVELNSGYEAGIDWELFGAEQTGRRIFDDTLITKPLNNIFSLHVGAGDFDTVIDLLSTQGNVQVLSSPRVSTLNNQKAVIKVGEDEFFVTAVSTSTTISGSSTIPNEDIELTPFFSGINLDVTPQISRDGEVTLHVHPAVVSVKDQTKSVVLGDETFELPLAISQVRETDTIVHAKNKQIVVIGGLMQNRMEEGIAALPVLGKIPFVGTYFRHTLQRRVKSELVILIRPIIVNDNTWTDEMRSTDTRLASMDKGFHVGDHPRTFGTEAEKWGR